MDCTDYSFREVLAGCLTSDEFRETLMKALKVGCFCTPSFHSYRDVPRIYEYDSTGLNIESRVLKLWNWHFTLSMEVVRLPGVLPPRCPEKVPVVKDEKTGTFYRADCLLKQFCFEKLEKASSLNAEKAAEFNQLLRNLYTLSEEELGKHIKDYGITAPDTQNTLSIPFFVKWSVQTPICAPPFQFGPYMRPRYEQDKFEDLTRLFEENDCSFPVATCHIGQSFEEEISPSRGLVIRHEFSVAEIQHFVDPKDTTHGKFRAVAEVETFMFPREQQKYGQSAIKIVLDQAVSKGIVDNMTLAYYIGKAFLFLTCLGIDKDHLRFRQRFRSEMAPYAVDCWVAEIECSSGWIECVDIAYSPEYDSQARAVKSVVALMDNEKLTKTKEEEKSGLALIDNEKLTETTEEEEKNGVVLNDNEKLSETREEEDEIEFALHDNGTFIETIAAREPTVAPNEKELGHAFEGNQKIVIESLLAMSKEEALLMKDDLASEGESAFLVRTWGKTVTIKDNMVNISVKRTRERERVFRPSVIEPSFCIERIIHCLFEHSLYMRPSKAGDERVSVFRFPPLVAPIECAVFSMREKKPNHESARLIRRSLTDAGVSYRNFIAGNTTGKEYAEADELGVPFAIIVDSNVDVSIRDRDSGDKVRVSVGEAASVVKGLIDGHKTWSCICSSF
ncbi:glycine--tRNA ligase, mitochondrial 1-like isoform X1 [Rhodamnia argentea]|uniref:Glycine--tRNA ligase, mitochondrial 1-like isoform X1 n=1 Tax=Rhodamnia argentea TaxID=178133 RepID=A0A8B8P3E9_9MYRT|nr:glycine--tRNA ligase, mitochondrial 1-like isoform X1 [Rhodamnia argentea]